MSREGSGRLEMKSEMLPEGSGRLESKSEMLSDGSGRVERKSEMLSDGSGRLESNSEMFGQGRGWRGPRFRDVSREVGASGGGRTGLLRSDPRTNGDETDRSGDLIAEEPGGKWFSLTWAIELSPGLEPQIPARCRRVLVVYLKWGRRFSGKRLIPLRVLGEMGVTGVAFDQAAWTDHASSSRWSGRVGSSHPMSFFSLVS